MKRALLPLLFLASACALLPDKDKTPQAAEKVGEPRARPQASIEAKQLAAEKEAEVVAEVIFPVGKSGLSTGERARLMKIERRIADKDKVDRLLVAAWADKALPGESGKDLPERAQKLAEERGKVVREFLENHGAKGVDIDFHNMAKKPGALSKFIGAEDARVKKSLEGARPSKAIVLLIKKEN